MAKKTDTKEVELQQQIGELTADLQRVHADFVNFRRRSDEERMQLMEVAKASAIKQLLPLIDTIERATLHLPQELQDNQWAKGVAQLAKQCEATLRTLQVEKIAALNQPFDPSLHQAVSYEEDGEGEELVIEVLQDGYRAGTQVLRPAMVKVGKRNVTSQEEN